MTRRIGIDWRVGINTGWGVFGAQLAVALLERDTVPVCFIEPRSEALLPDDQGSMDAMLAGYAAVERLRSGHDAGVRAPFPVLRALGNAFESGTPWLRAARDVGVVFFEDTAPDAAARDRLRAYPAVVAGSTWNAELLRSWGVERVTLAVQGVDRRAFAPGARSGMWGDRFVIFSGGKLEYRKAQDIVVAAVRAFAARHDEVLLVTAWGNRWPHTMQELALGGHVAELPWDGGGGTADFASWLARHGMDDRHARDVGMLDHGQFGRVMREAHVGLFPNRCEGGTNLVAMECLACGVPCVLSANTGHLDIADDAHAYVLRDQRPVRRPTSMRGVDGWGESSVDEVVAALEHAYDDAAERERRGAQAARFMDAFPWARCAERVLAATETG